MKTLWSLTVFIYILCNFRAEVQAQTQQLDNQEYSVKITTQKPTIGKGMAEGSNFVEFNGYTIEEILNTLFKSSVRILNRSPFTGEKYRVRIQSKSQSLPDEYGASLLHLLSQWKKLSYTRKSQQIERCILSVEDPITWQVSQIAEAEREQGMAKKVENGILYCYDCSLKELAEAIQTQKKCLVEYQNKKQFSYKIDTRNLDTELSKKGLYLKHEQAKQNVYEVTFE